MNEKQEQSGIRINKYLSDAGICSRREADKLIEAGRVFVEGSAAVSGQKILPGMIVCVDGKEVAQEEKKVLLLFHKPRGIVCSTKQQRDEMTVTEFLHYPVRIYPVGRLDKDTEGLLLITDDGALSHALMSPNRHVEKEYEAVVDGALAADAVLRFEQGMTLRDGTECKPAKLEILETEPELRVRVTLKEGKYHQVKRMIAAVGGTVTALKRLRLGGLWLDKTLAPGEFRELTQEELEKLTSKT